MCGWRKHATDSDVWGHARPVKQSERFALHAHF